MLQILMVQSILWTTQELIKRFENDEMIQWYRVSSVCIILLINFFVAYRWIKRYDNDEAIQFAQCVSIEPVITCLVNYIQLFDVTVYVDDAWGVWHNSYVFRGPH